MKRLITLFLSLMIVVSSTANQTKKEKKVIEMDVQSKKFLDQINAQQNPPLITQSIENLRKSPTFKGYQTNIPIQQVENITIPGPHGEILLRIYIPIGDRQFPVVVFYHGGGWVAGDLNYSDALCREICNRASVVVVSVDYRLSPEYKFPIPLDDCYAATVWTAHNIQKYNGDSQRLAICGASSGGNLAAAVALIAREKKEPEIKQQLLIYPVLDTNFETHSYEQFGEGYRLTKKNMQWFWQQYLRSQDDEQNMYVAPLKAPNVNNIPPTLIITAYFDPLRDDGELYAKRLQDADVPVIYKTYNSIHPFIQFADQLDIGKKGINDIAEYLRNNL